MIKLSDLNLIRILFLKDGCNAAIFGRRLDVITASAAKLSTSTGKTCIGIAGDVREPESLKAAVAETVKKFGRVDYVICGAAGNFLSPIDGLVHVHCCIE